MRVMSVAAVMLLFLGGVAAASTIYLHAIPDRDDTNTELVLDIVGDVPSPQPLEIPTVASSSGLPDPATRTAPETPPSSLAPHAQAPELAGDSDRTTSTSAGTESHRRGSNEPRRSTGLPSDESGEFEQGVPAPGVIQIPAIDVEAAIEPVGVNRRGEMESPTDYVKVGWWQYGTKPGEYGRAVLAGHLDSPYAPAVFYRLGDLQPGDHILVWSDDGQSVQLFVVQGSALYRLDAAPIEEIFGQSDRRELVLVTCGGVFDSPTQSYLHRQVVFAETATDHHPASPRE